MNFLKSIFKFNKNNSLEKAFNDDIALEAKSLLCGTGKCEIQSHKITITNYPFEPSIVYRKNTILAEEIDSMCVEFGICRIYIAEDIVFVSAEKKEELENFAKTNNIKLSRYSWNWSRILEPYLDTEFTKKNEKLILKKLLENGIDKNEVNEIRNEVGQQMYKYNFDTMLWDWFNLGLYDVLSAMRAKYNVEEFRDFYKRALKIDKRRVFNV